MFCDKSAVTLTPQSPLNLEAVLVSMIGMMPMARGRETVFFENELTCG